jgi:hypothetical protein
VSNDSDEIRPHAAAVVFERSEDVEAAITTAVDALRRAGLRVEGLLQFTGPVTAAPRRQTHLEVLASGEHIRLDQPLGSGAVSCNLDGDALARASQALRAAIDSRPDLLVISRFGKQESHGTGMRAEIAEALLSGIPVLVAVNATLQPAWERFLGSPPIILPPQAEAITAWVLGK